MADSLKQHASQIEKDFIDALKFRVGDGKSGFHKESDIKFGQAMKTLYQKYPDDLFIITMFAESLMNLRPWNLWCQKD